MARKKIVYLADLQFDSSCKWRWQQTLSQDFKI